MAEENIKGFTLEWILVGLLTFCLLSFAFAFMYYNSEGGLDSSVGDLLDNSRIEIRTKLIEVNENSDLLLNITAQTDPEAGFLGSRDSVATSYGFKEEASSNWDQFKSLLGWVITGDAGKTLIFTLGGMLGFLGVYYIIKFFRTGT